MIPDFLTYVKPLEDSGVSTSGIVRRLNSITVRKMDLAKARDVLRLGDVLFRDTKGELSRGSLGEASLDPAFDAYDKYYLDRVVSIFFFESEYDSTDPENAFFLDRSLTRLKAFRYSREVVDPGTDTTAIIPDTRAIRQKDIDNLFKKSAGGLLFGGLDNASIASSRDIYAAELAETARVVSIQDLRAEIDNTWLNVFETDGVTDAATARGAIKQGL